MCSICTKLTVTVSPCFNRSPLESFLKPRGQTPFPVETGRLTGNALAQRWVVASLYAGTTFHPVTATPEKRFSLRSDNSDR